MSVSTVIENATSTVGEGPYWDPLAKSLLYVDINAGDVHKWNSETKEDVKVHFGTFVGVSDLSSSTSSFSAACTVNCSCARTDVLWNH